MHKTKYTFLAQHMNDMQKMYDSSHLTVSNLDAWFKIDSAGYLYFESLRMPFDQHNENLDQWTSDYLDAYFKGITENQLLEMQMLCNDSYDIRTEEYIDEDWGSEEAYRALMRNDLDAFLAEMEKTGNLHEVALPVIERIRSDEALKARFEDTTEFCTIRVYSSAISFIKCGRVVDLPIDQSNVPAEWKNEYIYDDWTWAMSQKYLSPLQDAIEDWDSETKQP